MQVSQMGQMETGIYRPSGVVAAELVPGDIRQRFGQRLRALREAHDMTQMQMAVHFGIDRAFLSDVERGRKAIGLGLMEVIALGFKISLSELMRDL